MNSDTTITLTVAPAPPIRPDRTKIQPVGTEGAERMTPEQNVGFLADLAHERAISAARDLAASLN